MPDGLSVQNGKVEMIYVGREPWHGLGTRLGEPATGLIDRTFDSIQVEFRSMVRIQMVQGRLREYLTDVFPDPKDGEDDGARRRVVEARNECTRLFDTGRGNTLPGVKRTLWAGYNAVAEYIDYRQTAQTPSQRLDGIWFGCGYLTKARAFKVAVSKAIEWKN